MIQQPARLPEVPVLTDGEFSVFQQLIYDWAGIHMTEAKKALVSGRLTRRLRHFNFQTFTEYLNLVRKPENRDERQIMINLLTTNETYFFREPKHFEWLGRFISQRVTNEFRVWSAACSAGQEVYTIAMTVADVLGLTGWEVVGSDISEKMLDQALSATYPIEQAAQIPEQLLRRYCLKGVRDSAGKFRLRPEITERTHFFKINLIEPLPKNLGLFDVIFLRNVMIYFDKHTRKKVVEALSCFLKPGGALVIGHAESLHGVTDAVKAIQPTIYAARTA